jgi:type II secretory ATPase GspE/PulE/Tfp pilus assembly ATPase PilB-like protein
MSKDVQPLLLDMDDLLPEEAVHRLIRHGADLYASDLFFITNADEVAVLVRHLGTMRPATVLPLDLGRRAMAHLKAIAGMDVAEKRRPQDGRLVYEYLPDQVLDMRINIIPTLYGEDFTLRLLPRKSQLLALENLGLLRSDFNKLLDLLNSPGGFVLVTGPTGSGKTTTLYACLNYLNTSERKINTIEDPIEYALAGIRQSQVHPQLGIDFPDLLRNVIRQAPDVIMIGEIRDPATAEAAVRAANSGQLVLATLHAPLAAGAIQSMLSLGVHPHFLASSLLGTISQRLVRTLCPECKRAYPLGDSPHSFDEVQKWLGPNEGQVLYGPVGCPACHMLGYAGRSGVFEVLPLSRAIRNLILARQPTEAIRRQAIQDGMIEFRHAALLKVAQGHTSIEEVVRVVPWEYLDTEGKSA